MKRRLWWMVTVLIASVVLCAVLLWQKKSQNLNEVNTTEEKTASQVKLPGNVPVPSEHKSTSEPDSLWVVVSKKYPLQNSAYRPSDLVIPNVRLRADKSDEEKSVRSIVAPALERMLGDAAKAGHALMLASGNRGYDLQNTYYSSYVSSYGEVAADKFSAKPGQSEHQTGLALDISYQDMRDCYLDVCFGERPAGKWLAINAHTYGFILRYPADKSAVTQYQYEPWHFRYVGSDLATALYKSNLTLDEAKPYLER